MKFFAGLIALIAALTACEQDKQLRQPVSIAQVKFECPAHTEQVFVHAIDGQERYCAVIEGGFAGSWRGEIAFSGQRSSSKQVEIQSISTSLPSDPTTLREDIIRCAPNCYGLTSGGGTVAPEDAAALENWAEENGAACPRKEQERVIMPFTLEIAVSFCQEIEGDYVFVGDDMVVRGHYKDGLETGIWTYTSKDGRVIKEKNYDE